MAVAEFSIPPNHPALEGHFPGNPIVPGVVLLEEVIHTIESTNDGSWWIADILAVKFLRLLRPGQPCRVDFSLKGEDRLKFTCIAQGKIVAAGQLRCKLHTKQPGTDK